MTIEEMRNKLSEHCGLQSGCVNCVLGDDEYCDWAESVDLKVVERAYNRVFPTIDEPHIKDSGERRQFDTGAVRDIQEGKGRCDLMPLDVVANISDCLDSWYNDAFVLIHEFQTTGVTICLYEVLRLFGSHVYLDPQTMLLEVSKHFEEGAKKYGEHNWQKGIPTHCYVDSAVRHYLKWLRGDKDEPHDRAFVWNILCCIWTCIHKPELNDYGKKV